MEKKEIDMITYQFIYCNEKGLCYNLEVEVSNSTTTEKELHKIGTANLKRAEKELDGNKFELIDCYPKSDVHKVLYPSANFVKAGDNRKKFVYKVVMHHPKFPGKHQDTNFQEFAPAPYILNKKRIEWVEENICKQPVAEGWQITGIQFVNKEPLSGSDEDKKLFMGYCLANPDILVKAGKAEMVMAPEGASLKWIKVNTPVPDEELCWIPARVTEDGQVFTAYGIMEKTKGTEDEMDVRDFDNAPFKDYGVIDFCKMDNLHAEGYHPDDEAPDCAVGCMEM